MAFLPNAYNPNEHEAAQDFTPLPSGEYPVMVTDSDVKPTKAGNGHYLELTLQVIDGPMKGRLAWSRLNIDNPSAKAVEIANRELKSICEAIGHTDQVTDSAVLHNRPMIARIEYVKADGVKTQKDGNEVKAYKKIEGFVPGPAANTAPAAPSAPASTAGAPAWANRGAAAA
jgi:hypothetical protein